MLKLLVSGLVLAGALVLFSGAAYAATTVEVRDDASAVVVGAEVFLNCTLAGTTDGMGRITLASAAAGDHIAVRKLVKTGITAKPNHDGWGYHVYITNVVQNNDGTQTDHTVSSAAALQSITVRKDNAQIGLNLVASVIYNAATANLKDIADGLGKSSRYLFDVTDGQMFYEKVRIVEDKQLWDSADIRFWADMWPNADVDAIGLSTGWVNMPGPGFNGNKYTYGSWGTPNGFRTFVHELGHYAFGAYDEYFKFVPGGGTMPSSCTLDRATKTEDVRQCIMDLQYDATEMCATSGHNPDTAQGQLNGTSVWATFSAKWSGDEWTLKTPMSRGQVDSGPTTLACTAQPTLTIEEVTKTSCDPIRVHATFGGAGAAGVPATLDHNSDDIPEGTTNASGDVTIYGAVVGDKVGFIQSSGKTSTGLTTIGGRFTVASCASPLNVELKTHTYSVYYPFLQFRFKHDDVTVNIRFVGGDPGQFYKDIQIFGRQDGLQDQQAMLGYNQQTQSFFAQLALDKNAYPRFQLQVRTTNTSDEEARGSFDIRGALFHTGGPGGGPAGLTPPTGNAPDGWGLFPPESPVGVMVDKDSFADETSITVGTTLAPEDPPQGLAFVAGPYSVVGEVDPNGSFDLSLPFSPAKYCGLMKGTTAIYRWSSNGWTSIQTRTDEVQSVAYARVKQFGIYAVLGTPALDYGAAPSIQCPEDVSIETDPGAKAAAYIVDPAQPESVCGDAQVVGERSDGRPLGDPYPVGATAIVWTATTAAGKTAECRSQVTVTKPSPPETPPETKGCHCATPGSGRPMNNGWWMLSALVLGSALLRGRRRKA